MDHGGKAHAGAPADAVETPEKPPAPANDRAGLPSPTPSANFGKQDGDDLQTRVFRFLSTATPEALAGVGVALAAVTYFLLGQLGLLLIGAFGGVLLFVSWQARNPEVSRVARGETGLEVLARILEYKKDGASGEDGLDEAEELLARGFDAFRPETRDALNGLVDAIIRDYVKWWYGPIVPSDRSFPLACKKILTSFLLTVSNHMSRKRPADAFLDFLTNSSSIVIVFLSELSAVFAELPADSNSSASDAIYNYLASNPDSNLANLLSQKQQASKLRMVADDLLGFLDRPTHNCDPAKVFLREIIAGVILEMTLQSCSRAEWINSWIVYLLEAGEPDLSQAIDVGMQTRPEAVNTLSDFDGNLGNVGISKESRSSVDGEKPTRKEPMGHRRQLSKADEEMEEAMEEMKRMNQMIAEDDARRAKESMSASEAEQRLAGAMKRNADELEIQQTPREHEVGVEASLPSPDSVSRVSPDATARSSDDQSGRGDAAQTPLTPPSSRAESSGLSPSPKQRDSGSQFTSFDQLVPPAQDDGEASEAASQKPPPLTLHNASITIHDEPVNDKGRIKSKPSWEFLIQVEPATSHYPGWMTVRKYSDFERLHEVLRRIANISGASAFSEQHSDLPNWKVHTRGSLRGELERYVRDACWWQALAESEGMKRFLERDPGHIPTGSKSGFQAFENMGKNVLDVLASAPKGVAEGGKVVVGGVTGVLGNIGLGQRKSTSSSIPTSSALQDVTTYTNRLSISTPPRMDSGLSTTTRKSRDSMDSQPSSVVSTQPPKIAPMERRPSYNSQGEGDGDGLHPARSDRWEYAAVSARGSQQNSRASSIAPRSPSTTSLSGLKLPPPPTEMPDDYASPTGNANDAHGLGKLSRHNSVNGASSRPRSLSRNGSARRPAGQLKRFSKLSEQETRVAVELLFAVINELYTLSSAWNIRRTLLAAAKSFLLRPGNPSLTSIQTLIQTSVLDTNTSDGGIATHLKKLRENTLPTEEELAAWPPEQSAEEKEKLRVKARRLLIQSGVPAALMGVMGQTATTDALGRIFDCLQVEQVARGVFFGIMLQAVRVVTH